jgi:post-segregation antitoxin (ccd killing protein)
MGSTLILSDEETAKILGINLNKLYRICDIFDRNPDDEWDLLEGEHFEWLSKNRGTRRFYEEGAMAIAKYIQDRDTTNLISNFLDVIIERLTHRRKHTRQMLVRRRVILEFQNHTSNICRQGDLVFIARPSVIHILATNGKGLNAAARREQENDGLQGREPMRKGEHFDDIDGVQHWSQMGLARIAKNMAENLSQKSRRAWTEAVAEVIEDAIEQQQKYLDSFDASVRKAMELARSHAKRKCQVSLIRQGPADKFDLDVHHLFDRSTRPDLADCYDNLLVMHEDIHRGFHCWHGSESCEPKHFIDYLTTVESWRFSDKKKGEHLHKLINRLVKLQRDFETHYKMAKN